MREEEYAYYVNKLPQNVGLETWIWRQIVTSQRAHAKYKWRSYAAEWTPPHENILRTPLDMFVALENVDSILSLADWVCVQLLHWQPGFLLEQNDRVYIRKQSKNYVKCQFYCSRPRILRNMQIEDQLKSTSNLLALSQTVSWKLRIQVLKNGTARRSRFHSLPLQNAVHWSHEESSNSAQKNTKSLIANCHLKSVLAKDI